MILFERSIEKRVAAVGTSIHALLNAALNTVAQAQALDTEIADEETRLHHAKQELTRVTRLAEKLIELSK